MQQILQLLTISTSVLLGILSLGGFLGEYDWRLDLISHFRLQFLLFFLIILILSLVLKSKITLYLALFFIITNGLPFLSFYLPITAQSDKKGLLVLSANVKKDNHEYSRFLELVQRTNPDVIVLQEIDKEWQYSLTSLKKIYPYEVGEVREDYLQC